MYFNGDLFRRGKGNRCYVGMGIRDEERMNGQEGLWYSCRRYYRNFGGMLSWVSQRSATARGRSLSCEHEVREEMGMCETSMV